MSLAASSHPLLRQFAAFAAGCGLSAAWHLNREEVGPRAEDAPVFVSTSESKPALAAPSPISGTPSQPQGASRERGGVGTEPEMKMEPGEIHLDSAGLAETRHTRRLVILELSLRLGLSPAQSTALEAEALREIKPTIAFQDWLVGYAPSPEWLKENLSSEQAGAYSRYLGARKRERAEMYALEELHQLDSLFELTLEQRSTFLDRVAKKIQLHTSRVIEVVMLQDLDKLTREARMENVNQTLNSEQLRLYRQFLMEEEKLSALNASESKEASGHE